MADSTQKPDKRDSRVGEPISGTYENPGSRPTIDVVRESKPDRAWPIPHDRPLRESISAPRPSHLPAPEWTLDAAIRAASELEADLREKADEPEVARAFVDALRQVLPGVEVTVRMFSDAHVAWFVASAELATRESGSSQRVGISRAALSRARALAAVLGNLGGPTGSAPGASDSGVIVPAVRICDEAEPIVTGMMHAVDALATDDGLPLAVVTVESADASRVRSLEPLLALFADRLGNAIGRLRVSQNEEFLRRYLQEMFEQARGPIIAIAPDRSVRAVNRPALALIEQPLEGVIGTDLVAILRSDEHRERVAESFAAVLRGPSSGGQSTASFELRVNKKDGTTARTRWNTATIHDVDGTVGAVVAMGEDLSDVQRLEQQIIHAEKLATLGQLAAGVLHELNNPLTSITVYSEYLLGKHKRAGTEPGDVEKLGRIVESAARMTKFTRDLVTYARPTAEAASKVSMIEVLEQSLGFCEHVLDEAGVLVERSYAQDLSPVEAVRGQLHQIFVNLITNATQAMANDPRRTAIDAPRSKLSVSIEGRSQHILVRISDNGPGVPGENVARIFEPFFTTKGEGKGTGLGLSIVRNLVEQHGGTISVESRTEARSTSSGSTVAAGQTQPPPATTGTSFELRFKAS
jgi:PAS domain S-box-containing protein